MTRSVVKLGAELRALMDQRRAVLGSTYPMPGDPRLDEAAVLDDRIRAQARVEGLTEVAAWNAYNALVPDITEQTRKLFLEYAQDADNWGGTPLVGGNVGGSKQDRGNLTQLKKAGLIATEQDADGCLWLYFTDAGKAYAASLGVKL